MTSDAKAERKRADIANELAASGDVDILLYNGDIDRFSALEVIKLVSERRRRKAVLLILTTPGGDPHGAYKIARCLQHAYSSFAVLIAGFCKSAGTLCVLGAHEVVMCDQGELGPLDVQFYKKDELGEMSSGLVLPAALDAMREQAFAAFEDWMLRLKERSQGLITLKTATELAAKMAIGLFEPVYRQVDPMQIGEVARSMAIAKAYGKRLAVRSKNFDDNGLTILVDRYPDHGFVIDRREAEAIFKKVRAPNALEHELVLALGMLAQVPVDDGPAIQYVSEELTEGATNEKRAEPDVEDGARQQGTGTEGDVGNPASAGQSAGVPAEEPGAAAGLKIVPKD